MPKIRKKKANLDKRQNIRLDTDMLDRVATLADREERTVSNMLRILVREGLEGR